MSLELLPFIDKGGCSAKLPASALEYTLNNFSNIVDPNLIVGMDTHDDAGVYKINDELAIIFTTDFFPPVCADPYEFGEIASANSLSDVYAMGGTPFLALNIVMFPSSKLPVEILRKILDGALNIAKEAETMIIGGHTIDDITPKFGLAVIGRVDPKRVITNSGLEPGDQLILTKPIGTGVIIAGKKLDLVDQNTYIESIKWMKMLNKSGAEVMQKFNVKGATDITGFGLIGHAYKMAKASNVQIVIDSKSVPLIPNSYELVEYGCIPTTAFQNLQFVSEFTDFKLNDYNLKMLLNDAQTSGGLLMGIKANEAEKALKMLKSNGFLYSSIIGQVQQGDVRVIVA